MMTSTKRIEMRLDELRKHLSRANSEILIISPYLTPGTLSDVLSGAPEGIDVTVICSWRDRDLLFGSSHLETYHLCRDNGWTLRVDHDRMPRTIHLKAYVVDGEHAMIGSANMTGRGMGGNIESLLPVSMEAYPPLFEAINDSQQGSIEVDDAIYKHFFERVQNFPDREEPNFPGLKPIHGATALEILDHHMPPEPTLSQIIQCPSIREALPIRGLRFGDIRRFLRSKPLLDKSRDNINDRTTDVMRKIVEADTRFDIQKRYGTDCLVWKIHHIVNKEIKSQLEPYIGKPLRELGLEEPLWDKATNGTAVRNFCLSKLSSEINTAISNLNANSAKKSLRLGEDGKPLNPTPIGPRIVLTDSEGNFLNLSPEQMLPDDELRDSLWLPSFCIFEANSGTKLGDVSLLGFGLWESNYKFVQDTDEELADDIRILAEQESPFYDNPFRKQRDSKVIFTKIGDAKGNSHLPLGHPNRKMSRYLTQAAMTSIADDILSHDH